MKTVDLTAKCISVLLPHKMLQLQKMEDMCLWDIKLLTNLYKLCKCPCNEKILNSA